MNVYLILPILIPLTAAITSLLAWRSRRIQRTVGVLGSGGLLVAALALLDSVWNDGIQAAQMGTWPAPFGITLVADLFSTIMVGLTGLIGLTVSVYSVASMDPRREAYGYYPLLQILLAGCCGAFLTGDLFNLYVWFEVMLIASFVLLALGGERPQMEGAIKYVTLNLLSSALFLAAVGIVYATTGTLNMADLSGRLREVTQPGVGMALAMLFLVAFGIKAAAFPLFFWLPASYHTPPVAVSAVFAGLLTKVGVYALIRVFTLLFVQNVAFTHQLILALAALTMVTGVLGAMVQNEFRRILSFHIISQVGYMLMGLGLYTPLGLAGSIFYILHHIVVKTNLFLVSGVVHRLRGSYELKNLGGLYERFPILALLFLIPALSLAGVPPLSGFWAKLSLIKAGAQAGRWTVVTAALLVSLLTLFSMMKIWAEAFWKRAPEETVEPAVVARAERRTLLLPIAVLAGVTVAIGLLAEPFFLLAERAAEQLMNPAEYVRAVLGRASW
jgi:multicomponent Na+:H+ antiporter subunit D